MRMAPQPLGCIESFAAGLIIMSGFVRALGFFSMDWGEKTTLSDSRGREGDTRLLPRPFLIVGRSDPDCCRDGSRESKNSCFGMSTMFNLS
jgi:hypothetical protein